MYFFFVASMSDDVIVDAPPPLTLNTGQKRARQPIDTYNLEDVEDEENLQKKKTATNAFKVGSSINPMHMKFPINFGSSTTKAAAIPAPRIMILKTSGIECHSPDQVP